MSSGGGGIVGGTVNSVLGLVGATVTLLWVILPGAVGCGTQRYSIKPDAENLQDWARFGGATLCRMSGEIQVAFPDSFGKAGKVSGTGGYSGIAPLPTGASGGSGNQEWMYPDANKAKKPSINPWDWLPQSDSGTPIQPSNPGMPQTTQGGMYQRPGAIGGNPQVNQSAPQYVGGRFTPLQSR